MTTEEFVNLGKSYIQNSKCLSESKTFLRRFKSFFGLSPNVCSIVWNKIKSDVPSNSEPKHLLWSICFLKQYEVEHIRRSLFSVDEKTLRKWTWIYIEILSNLNVIQWDRRFEAAFPNQTCFCSLDGVDFRILEPTPFNRRWYSHKFRGPGLRYEVGLCIRTGLIVWKHGGYPCGEYSDLKLAREAYVDSVMSGEMTLVDKGYKDSKFFITPNTANGRLHKSIMARHETVNKRLKQFKILNYTYRHSLKKHPMVFHAVSNLTQISLENGEPLYRVV